MSDPGPLELLRALVALEPQKSVAERYDISPQYLNDVLHQRREISAALANRLGYWRRIVFIKKRPVCDNCPHPDTCGGGFIDCNAARDL